MQIGCSLLIKNLFLLQIFGFMKKLLVFFLFIFALNSCDDGDIIVETINFDNVTASKCGDKNIIYKINGSEVLQIILSDTEYAGLFVNEEGKKTLSISTPNQVRYRFYDATVTQASICNDLQPATPVITQEWIATSGTIEVTASLINSAPDTTTGATKLDRYNYNIVFKDIVFEKPSGNQIEELVVFGDYSIKASLPFNFEPTQAKLCPSGNTLYNARPLGSEGLYVLNFDNSLFSTAAADLDIPKTREITSTSNNLIYKLFAAPLLANANENYFCTGDQTSLATTEIWTAASGTIEVITTSNGTGQYRHSIRLKGVTFKKGNHTFYYGDDTLYGTIDVTI